MLNDAPNQLTTLSVRRAIWLAAALVVLVGASNLAAQWHPHGYAASTGGRVFVFDPVAGTRSTILSPVKQDIYDLAMDVDNRRLLVVMRDHARIIRLDPKTLAVTGTLWSGAPLVKPVAVAIDQNGDTCVADAGLRAVLRITPGGKIHTIIYNFLLLDRPEGGMRVDPDTGDLLVLNTTFAQDNLYRVARDGSKMPVQGRKFSGRYGFDVHIPTGDIFTTSCCTPFAAPVRVLHNWQSSPQNFGIRSGAPVGAYCVRTDRASARGQRILLGPTFVQGGVWSLDLTTRITTTLHTTGASTYALEFIHGRNVQTVRTVPGRWDVRLSFPGQPGQTYFTLLNVTGTRPGVPLPDGRRINFNFDALARLLLINEHLPFFRGHVGILNAAGEGTAVLDVRPMAELVRGIRLWVQTVTFHRSAPLGIDTIADPVPLVIEGI